MVSRVALVSIVLFAVVAGRAPAEGGLENTRFLKRCATYLDSNGRIQDIWLTGPRKFVEGALRELVTTEVGRHVSSVTFSHTDVTAEMILALKPLRNLVSLEIGGEGGAAETDVETDAYAKLAELRQVKRLRLIATGGIEGTVERRASIAGIEQMRKLEELEIYAAISLEDMKRVAALPSLRSLYYDGRTDGIDNHTWARIARMPSLRELRIERLRPGFSAASAFSAASDISIETLIIVEEGVFRRLFRWSDEDILAISRISTLRKLRLGGCSPLTADQSSLLARLRNLEELSVTLSGDISHFGVAKSLKRLRKLSINMADGCSFRALHDLKNHPALVELEISGNVNSRQLAVLKTLPSLKKVELDDIGSTRKVVEELGLSGVEISFFGDKRGGGGQLEAITPSERIARFTQQWDNSAWGNRSRKEGGGYMLPADSNLWKLRMETMRALVASGPDAVEPLLEALRSQDVATRILAAQTLGFLGKHVPSKPLVKALRDDPEASVRLYAADALGMIGGADVRESLESLKETEKNKDVRKHIMYALGRKNRDGAAAAADRLVAWDTSNIDTAHVGGMAPDFELVSVNGKRYRLSSFRGKKAVVLVFIYGDT